MFSMIARNPRASLLFYWGDSSRQVRIDSIGEMLGLTSTVSLQPEPVPLDVKVVLIGRRILYYLLAEYDPEFLDLFKVEADFEDETDRGGEPSRARPHDPGVHGPAGQARGRPHSAAATGSVEPQVGVPFASRVRVSRVGS